jgi:hypothetical protein
VAFFSRNSLRVGAYYVGVADFHWTVLIPRKTRVPTGSSVKGSGGKKGRSGRKSKAHEMGLAALLDAAFTPKDRQDVVKNLTRIAKSNDAKAAVSAAGLLMGYTFGKPTEKHEHSGKDGGPIIIKVEYAP